MPLALVVAGLPPAKVPPAPGEGAANGTGTPAPSAVPEASVGPTSRAGPRAVAGGGGGAALCGGPPVGVPVVAAPGRLIALRARVWPTPDPGGVTMWVPPFVLGVKSGGVPPPPASVVAVVFVTPPANVPVAA